MRNGISNVQWYFWTFSPIIIKDLYTNKVNCAKQTDRRRNLLGVPALVKASQKHEITFITFAQLNNPFFFIKFESFLNQKLDIFFDVIYPLQLWEFVKSLNFRSRKHELHFILIVPVTLLFKYVKVFVNTCTTYYIC